MAAYYNENDPNAVEWLRQLIKLGAIAPGDVDERSIEDVSPVDLKPYDQCHFFAGIGVWSYALRQAGIPDDYPVWTGSCPCQPFSAAGKGEGLADERHLWPAMFWLIQQCRPVLVFGEQVASKDGLGWWDIVASDLENSDYACAAVDLCAAGIGAPHIRQRLFWVGYSNDCRRQSQQDIKRGSLFYKVDESPQLGQQSSNNGSVQSSGMGDTCREGLKGCQSQELSGAIAKQEGRAISQSSGSFWDDAIWLQCKDGKLRATKPGIFPLAYGLAPDLVSGGDSCIQTEETTEARAMRLKGYGNAIVEPLATIFIQSVMEVCHAQ